MKEKMWVISYDGRIPVKTDGTFLVDINGNNIDGICFPNIDPLNENFSSIFTDDVTSWRAHLVPVEPIGWDDDDSSVSHYLDPTITNDCF